MACIIKKLIKGRPYYYAAESARKDGGPPRIVWQKYLGTLDDIMQRAENGPGTPVKEVDIFEAGGIAAMLRIFEKIQLIEIIDKIIPKRKQGPSIGQYIALAAINRIVAPCSKLEMPDWYKKTVLFRLWKHPPEVFNSQRFWDHMDLITENDISEIQKQIAINVKKTFSLCPEVILYDTTNFFTYIATRNTRNTLAQRGKNKAKRNDLRQVGLALLVSKDFQIPLFHSVYQGNLNDRGIFPEMAMSIKKQYDDIYGMQNDSTIAFDKGNISDDAMERMIISEQHFVCAIPNNTVTSLFTVPSSHLNEVPGLSGTKAVSGEVELWKKKFKYTLAYSESYFVARMADLSTRIEKCEQKLHDLDKAISKYTEETRKQNAASLKQIKAKVDAILSGEYLSDVFEVKVENVKGLPKVSYQIDHSKIDYIMKHELGRTMLITTHFEWDEKEIISTYRDQNSIENAFRHMKNKDYLHWQPTFHWTDQKIKVHGLYCVLALLGASLAHKIVRENNLQMSLLEMIEELSDIREVGLIYDDSKMKSKGPQITLSRMSATQRKLANALEIAEVLGNTPDHA